jgi:uncharacterized protein (TIGR02453 family)
VQDGSVPTTFRGWPDSALVFYEGLEADNSRAYWHDHKDVYERDVKAPMVALGAELRDEFGPPRLFRPYRDTRFSRDKSPYKTAIAAMIGDCYVQLSAAGLLAGAGTYHMAPDQLERYRAAVAAERSGRALEHVVADLTTAHLEVTAMETLKTAPRGYPKEHERVALLRNKGLVAMRSWAPAAWLATAGAKKRVVEVFRAAAPLLAWLDTHVGPSHGAADAIGARSGRNGGRSGAQAR